MVVWHRTLLADLSSQVETNEGGQTGSFEPVNERSAGMAGGDSVEDENMLFFWNFKTIYWEFCAVERSLHRRGSLHAHNGEGYQMCICFCEWSADNSGKSWFQIHHFFKRGVVT